MAGNQVIPTSGGKFLPKLIGTLVVLAVLALVIKHPTSAASSVNSLWTAGTGAVDGLAAFFQAVGK
jgi:hypothetical protein